MNTERLMRVIVGPHISEKATRVADKDKHIVFKVLKDANKQEIKEAVEKLFEVKVAAVNVTQVKGKTRNFKQIQGTRKDWKKAYVSLEEGHDINFANVE